MNIKRLRVRLLKDIGDTRRRAERSQRMDRKEYYRGRLKGLRSALKLVNKLPQFLETANV